MEQKNNPAKMIIVTAVIIIIFVSIVIGIIVAVSSNNNEQNEILQNLSQNEIEEEEEEENTILDEENITIIDDETVDFSRRYGRIDIIWIDQNNNEIDNPLRPNANGLTPVKFDANKAKFVETTEDDSNWYNYDLQSWANAINYDGSYFVWIPRYAYRITYYSNSQYTKVIGYCDGRGIMKLNDDNTLTRISKNNTGIRETSNHYIVAPAFSKDTASGYRNGGWDSDLSGIWVAKYEASQSDAGTVYSNQGFSGIMKIQPNVTSWRSGTIGEMFTYCQNINNSTNASIYGISTDKSKIDPHMMKNMEWGAVAYLTQSSYGRNGKNVYINNSSDFITGNSGGHDSANEMSGTTFEYTTTRGQGASTTGTIYGIYDMSGGAYDRTMSNWAGTVGSSRFTTSTFPGGSNGSKYYEKYTGTSSQNITSACSKVLIALYVISSKFPIGVGTI